MRVAKAATHTPPLLIANDPDAAAWRPDLTVVNDRVPGCGSLGGIYTALTAARGPVLVLAWDMPFLSAELLTALVAGAADFDAYIPESNGPRGLEPLCAVYAEACTDAVRACLESQRLAANAFHDAIRLGILPLASVRTFGDPAVQFLNVNRPEDLTHAQQIWQERQALDAKR